MALAFYPIIFLIFIDLSNALTCFNSTVPGSLKCQVEHEGFIRRSIVCNWKDSPNVTNEIYTVSIRYLACNRDDKDDGNCPPKHHLTLINKKSYEFSAIDGGEFEIELIGIPNEPVNSRCFHKISTSITVSERHYLLLVIVGLLILLALPCFIAIPMAWKQIRAFLDKPKCS